MAQMLESCGAPVLDQRPRREGFAAEAPAADAKPPARQAAALPATGAMDADGPKAAAAKPRRLMRMADGMVEETQRSAVPKEATRGAVCESDSGGEDEDVVAAEKTRLLEKQALAQAKQGPRMTVSLSVTDSYGIHNGLLLIRNLHCRS
jgi:hypothetical protein